MRPEAGRLYRVGFVLLLGLPCLASTRQQPEQTERKPADSKQTTRIVLGSDSAEPGSTVVIPIYFSPPEGVRVGHMSLGVNFVSRNLKFARFERGIAAEIGNIDLRTEIKEEKNEQGLEVSTLTIETLVPAHNDAPKEIPSGLLGYITFQIGSDARTADIALRASASGTELVTKKPLQDVLTKDGQVKVLAPGSRPLVSCFFFSH